MPKTANAKTWNLSSTNGRRYSNGLGGSWQKDASYSTASSIPLEIIAPRAGLGSAQGVHYRARTGLKYRVRVGAIGGRFPYKMTLLTAPSGCTVVQETLPDNYNLEDGIGSTIWWIEWDNPTAGSHSMQLECRDQNNDVDTVSWTLTVNTSLDLFLDSVNGNDAWDGLSPTFVGGTTGPKRTFGGIYGADRFSTEYQGMWVWLLNGTYYTNSASVIEDGIRVAMNGAKPHIFQAYPSHAPIIDTQDAYISVNVADMAFNGITFQGLTDDGDGTMKTISCSADRLYVCGCTFGNQIDPGRGSQNPCHIFSPSDAARFHWLVANNAVNDVTNMLFSEIYSLEDSLYEMNLSAGQDANSYFAYRKSSCQRVVLRGNRQYSGGGGLSYIDAYNVQNDCEDSWNLWISTGNWVKYGSEANVIGTVFTFRNTFVGGHMLFDNVSGGPISLSGNVRQHDGNFTADAGIDYERAFSATVSDGDTKIATSGLVNATTGRMLAQTHVDGFEWG